MSERATDLSIRLPEGAVRVEDLNRLVRATRLEPFAAALNPGELKDFPGTDKQGVRRKTFLVTNTHASDSAELIDIATGRRVMTLFPLRTAEPIHSDADLRVKNPDGNLNAITLDVCEIYYA